MLQQKGSGKSQDLFMRPQVREGCLRVQNYPVLGENILLASFRGGWEACMTCSGEPVLVPVWWVRANWHCCVLCRHCSSVQYAALRTTDDHDSALLSDASSRNVGYTCYSVFKWDWNSTEAVYIGTYTRKCRGNRRLDPLVSPIWQQMESHSKIR